MIYFEEVFSTYLGTETDPKYDSPDEEIRELITRQNLIFDLLEGKAHADTVLDCLDEQGIDPVHYLNCVEESIEFVVENNIQIINANLWVPQY